MEEIDHLIINSPYEEPKEHWLYQLETKGFERKPGRRKAGYLTTTPGYKGRAEDPGVFCEIELVNEIRPRVDDWRERGYPGVSGITRRLLDYWNDPNERERRFFFCQLEAVETLIWLTEAPDSEKTGIVDRIPTDGGDFRRLCAKMATGTGKTVVMAMVIAWHVLNKVTYRQDVRFSKNIFVVAPGLTVKSRLVVLQPAGDGNYYEEFGIVPTDLMEKLRQGKVRICNWHALGWESEERIAKKKGVDKRGAKSDEAYTREVLAEMFNARNILVINDEAHHAWRVNPEAKGKYLRQRDMKDSAKEATIWVGGLVRLHKTRGILACYDFSATPLAPTGHKSAEDALFKWIISDFGLSDAIESGLVKTPRVVVRDDAVPDAKTYKSRLYHIYNDPEVKDDLNRKAGPEERLPDLVIDAYRLLGCDWKEALQVWKDRRAETPPVMITVANRTETAARVRYALERNQIRIEELCDPERILHIDSKVLAEAEAADDPVALNGGGEAVRSKPTKAARAEQLRRQVDTVGKPGLPGAEIQKVISVGMLSEGWDAKTVTHIMGLRAFTSQLLCEQVVGRGLRRVSYEVDGSTGLFAPEYVNVFGVPFSFLPHEDSGSKSPPTVPKTRIYADPDKDGFEIRWPNVTRIEHTYRPRLCVDWKGVEPLHLKASTRPTVAELAPVIAGKFDVTKSSDIDLKNWARGQRLQKIVFEMAQETYERMRPDWKGSKEVLLAQLVGLIEQFIDSGGIVISPKPSNQGDRRVMLILNMSKVLNHLWQAIRFENAEKLRPVFDQDRPFRATGDMRTWYTGKPCEVTRRSHINRCVYDSAWEASESFEIDRNEAVSAWVKNDHLGFEILYIYNGVVKRYWPDFIIRLKSGEYLVLETKGQETEQDRAKRKFLDEWCKAVNGQGECGRWHSAISMEPSDIKDILRKYDGG